MTNDTADDNQARLYLITPALTESAAFVPILHAALAAAPVACVRLNMAVTDEDLVRRAADQVREVCHTYDVAMTITDHFRLAAPLGLDGVHLANPRISVRDVRKELGEDMIVGAFAGVSRHEGMTMAEASADYVSFGPVGDTALGDGAVADNDLFTWWAEMIETPVVAEGGVTLENAPMLASVADFLCVDGAVWDHPDGPAEAVKAFAKILED
ncbi:MAG: thiamine phosphate synthase [Pikeienuella sp.]